MSEVTTPRRWAWMVLFTSSTTLVCCALPILLVSLGLGAVSASLFASMPFLVTLAKYKTWMFVGSAVVLGFSAWLVFRPGRACPIDPELAAKCEIVQRWNTRIFWVSIGIWTLGAVAAFLALPVYQWINGGQ